MMKFLTPYSPKPDLPLLIYLPGMDGTGELFYRQGEKLQHFFDIRCLAMDFVHRRNWDQLSTQVVDLIQKELHLPLSSPPRSVYLCGESFGGCLAIKVALQASELFEKLIFINSASSFNQRPWLSLGIVFTQWTWDAVHRGSTFGLLPFLVALNRLLPADRRRLLQAMQSAPASVISWRLSLLQHFRVADEKLRQLTRPCLVIASRRDRLLPSIMEGERLCALLPQSHLHILPESGHACLLEKDLDLSNILQKTGFMPPDSSEYTRQNPLQYTNSTKIRN